MAVAAGRAEEEQEEGEGEEEQGAVEREELAEQEEQAELVDEIAERVQSLGGVTVAVAHDVAEYTKLERPPIDREEVPVQISRLLEAHEIILTEDRGYARIAADHGDDGTNDIIVSKVIRTNEAQVWFLSEHLVKGSAVDAE